MEDAANALDKARKHAEAGQDSVALRLCSISLRLHETAEARELKEWIENWGADTPAGLKARSVLSANNYYEIFGVQYLAPYPINGLKKIYYTLSRDLHPDKSKANGAEDAFKLVSQAHATLTDEYQKRVRQTQRELVGNFEELASCFRRAGPMYTRLLHPDRRPTSGLLPKSSAALCPHLHSMPARDFRT